MTSTEARKITAMLASLYDVPAWTEDRLRGFASAIQDLDYEATGEAAQQYVKLRRERPQPADLRRLVVETDEGMPGPETAWGELHACLQTQAKLPTFSHDAIGEALRLTGRDWQELRLLQYDQYPWLRRDFLGAYREVSEQIRGQRQASVGGVLPISREEAAQIVHGVEAHRDATTPAVTHDHVDQLLAPIRTLRQELEADRDRAFESPTIDDADKIAEREARRADIRRAAQHLRNGDGDEAA